MSRDFDQPNGHDSAQYAPDFFLDVWRRRKWIAAAVFAAVLAGALSVAASLPDLYRATAKVIVDRQEVSEAFVQPSVTAELETRIQTIDQRVRSREILGGVITSMNLYPELRQRATLDSVVERMRRDMVLRLEGVTQASGRNATIAFTLSYRGGDPDTVSSVANALAVLYVEENTKSRESQAMKTAGFLEQEVSNLKRELNAQESKAGDFAQSNAFELPQQLEVNMAAVERLTNDLRRIGDDRLRILERRDRLERELAETEAPDGASSEETVATRLNALRRERTELRRQYSDLYPEVIRVNAEIAALEAQVRSGESGDAAASRPAGKQRANPALAEVDAQLAALTREETKLKQQIRTYEARIEATPRRQREMEQLSRGTAAERERLEKLVQKYEDARRATNLELGQDVEQFRILDPAIPPRRPVAPDRLWLVAMGLAAALALAVAAVVVAEKLDMTFHSSDDVRAFTGLPVLATIRQVPTAASARRQRLQVAAGMCVAVLGLSLIAAGSYYVAAGNEDVVRLIARGDA
ncbi:MAG TPA: Wzz/FepE/Etk N-terminal domain-containing protein [Vicinamibacterales bacterium]|nr:Wzz/FepE/Etk N-terminal domain-containing protein [Vicinamibacterales bacterium]